MQKQHKFNQNDGAFFILQTITDLMDKTIENQEFYYGLLLTEASIFVSDFELFIKESLKGITIELS
jgi:hypothetical protein